MSNSEVEKNGDIVDDTKYSMQTHMIYGKNVTTKWDYSHHVLPPISSSVFYKLDSVERGAEGFLEFANANFINKNVAPIYIYDRLGEPNKDMLEENLAYAERGECAVTFSTGMGAISSILCTLCKSENEIIAHHTLYGCTISLMTNWLPRFNIKTNFTDLTNLDNLSTFLNSKTRVIYLETPSNPTLEIIDIAAIRKIIDNFNEGKEETEKVKIVVDNTFATPFCQRPIELGSDFSVSSLTKGIGGFGTDMGGVIVGKNIYRNEILMFRKDFGAVLNNKSAWNVITYGLPTLHIRIKQQMNSAGIIADYLNNHPKVELVNYPGLKSFKFYELAKKQMVDFNGEFAPGSLIYFTLKGKDAGERKENGKNLMNIIAKKAYTITLAVSLGYYRTLIEHPASMTHSVIPPEKLNDFGLDAGGIRLSLGLEDPKDIIKDLDYCLSTI